MKAAVLVEPRRIEIMDMPEPRMRPDEVLVAPIYAGLCGSDEHVHKGEFGQRVKFPLIPGHEFVARVLDVGEEAEGLAPGDRVAVDPILPCMRCAACLDGRMCACRKLRLYGIDQHGAFAERLAVKWHNCFKAPERLSDRDAALTEPFAIGVHATRRAAVDPADVVVVIGAGKIGLCVLDVVLKTAAIQVIAVDLRQDRLERATRLGAHAAINAREKDPVEEVMRLTDGRGADRVIEVVGHAELVGKGVQPVTQATQMVRSAGRVVVLGQGPDEEPVFWKPFVWREAEIITSRVTLGEFPRALAMLERGLLHPDVIATHEVPLSRAADAYAIGEDPSRKAVKVLVKVEGGL